MNLEVERRIFGASGHIDDAGSAFFITGFGGVSVSVCLISVELYIVLVFTVSFAQAVKNITDIKIKIPKMGSIFIIMLHFILESLPTGNNFGSSLSLQM